MGRPTPKMFTPDNHSKGTSVNYQLPEPYEQALDRLLNPTQEMRDVAQLMAKGMDYTDAAHEVGLALELVLAWSQLHLGFIDRYRHLVWLSQERRANTSEEYEVLRTESDIEMLELAMTSNQPAPPTRSTGTRVKRSPAPPTAAEMLADIVDTVYAARREAANDLDLLDGDLLARRYPTRQQVETEIVQERLGTLAKIEEDTK